MRMGALASTLRTSQQWTRSLRKRGSLNCSAVILAHFDTNHKPDLHKRNIRFQQPTTLSLYNHSEAVRNTRTVEWVLKKFISQFNFLLRLKSAFQQDL